MAPARTRPRTIIRFDDFSAGEYGDLGAAGAPRNSFTGRNVIRYLNGLVGPRPGLKEIEPSGMPTGTMLGIAGFPFSALRDVLFVVGNTLYGFLHDAGSPAVATWAPALGATPTVRVPFEMTANKLYLSVRGDKSYSIEPNVGTVLTSLTGSPGGRHLCTYGSRLVVASPSGGESRIHYSGAADFTSWPALNFFDIGNADLTAHFIQEIRNRLAIGTAPRNEWWILSGTPGVNDSLRRATRGQAGLDDMRKATRIGDDLWFTPPDRDYPVLFTGSVTERERYRHLRFLAGASAATAAAGSATEETVVFVGATTNKAMFFHNGIWTYHTFGANVEDYIAALESGRFVISDGGDTGVAPKFYILSPELNRPGKAGDTFAQPGDDSTTPLSASLTLPEWRTEDGSEMIARTVIVDFAKWDTGSASTNHFDVTVKSLRRDGVPGSRESEAQSFDEATSGVADETTDRRIFRFGEQGFGHGFQVDIENMRGCAIRAVSVIPETEPARA